MSDPCEFTTIEKARLEALEAVASAVDRLIGRVDWWIRAETDAGYREVSGALDTMSLALKRLQNQERKP